MKINNKEMFESLEFDTWAYGKDLYSDEKYLFEEYLDKNQKTVEAGTGGGRILLEMKKLGFKNLHGYDYLPEFIEEAKNKDISGSICFEVEDATHLSYEDNSFEQIIYLQQILCVIEGDEKRLKAVKEAYRILKKGGTALFSFLCFEGRNQSMMYMPYIAYLRVFRGLFGRKRLIQELPWLKPGGKVNYLALLDGGPYVYWYKIPEAHQLLQEVGFEIVATGSNHQISQGQMCSDPKSLMKQPISDRLYVVCTK